MWGFASLQPHGGTLSPIQHIPVGLQPPLVPRPWRRHPAKTYLQQQEGTHSPKGTRSCGEHGGGHSSSPSALGTNIVGWL